MKSLALIFGGRSGEHEISLLSSASVFKQIDANRYDIVPISIDKEGVWRRHGKAKLEKLFKIYPEDNPVTLLRHRAGQAKLVDLINHQEIFIDIALPIMHGPLCEDGALQGLLELVDIPYAGAGVLASALGMDKEFAKRLFMDAKIPILPFRAFHKQAWKKDRLSILEQLSRGPFPVFVKPANMGSSVGVHKVKKASELGPAIDDAFCYDLKILVEEGIPAREIEVSVIEELDPSKELFASVAGEIIPSAKHEFYSYEAKYLDNQGAALKIPAALTPDQMLQLQDMSRRAFRALGCSAFARVDFLVHKDNGQVFLNEINTIPGFTSISMFPKMLEASGMPYRTTVQRLLDLAERDYKERQALKRDFVE